MFGTLTLNLQTTVYVTPSNASCGLGFATAPRTLYDSLFATLPTCVIQQPDSLTLNVSSRHNDGHPGLPLAGPSTIPIRRSRSPQIQM